MRYIFRSSLRRRVRTSFESEDSFTPWSFHKYESSETDDHVPELEVLSMEGALPKVVQRNPLELCRNALLASNAIVTETTKNLMLTGVAWYQARKPVNG